jgi:hypothetical protein
MATGQDDDTPGDQQTDEQQTGEPAEEQPQMPAILSAPSGTSIEQPAKLIRIATMIRELLQDVRQSTPDEAGRRRLREVYERALTALKEGVSKDLQD